MTYGPDPNRNDGWVYFVGGLAIVLLLALCMGWAEWIHGDWRCAFAQCRIETR